MRKAIGVVLGLGALLWSAGASHGQNVLGGLGDAVKKGASDAAKQQVDETLGVSGAADAAVNPKAAAKGAANSATSDVNTRATGAAQDAVGGALGGAQKSAAPAPGGDEPQ